MATWKLDTAHTEVNFSAKHMMITNVRGKFGRVEGEISLDEAEPTRSSGQLRIAAASLSTGLDQRDQHLRSADFFDAERHPWIVATVTAIEPAGDAYRVTADVTIREITRPVVLDAEFLGVVSGMKGGRHAGFHLSGTISREAWGLNWNVALEKGSWLVGKDISLEVDVAADEVAPALEERASAVA
jgi:polyisoprenoid-binding protein YceI